MCLVSVAYFSLFWLFWVFADLNRLSLAVVSRGCSTLQCTGFLLWWLLFAEHSSRARGLQSLQHTGLVVAAHGPSSMRVLAVIAHGLCSCCSQALELRLSSYGHTSLVAPQHVESSQIKDQTSVPCAGRRISSTVPPGKPFHCLSLNFRYILDMLHVCLPPPLRFLILCFTSHCFMCLLTAYCDYK